MHSLVMQLCFCAIGILKTCINLTGLRKNAGVGFAASFALFPPHQVSRGRKILDKGPSFLVLHVLQKQVKDVELGHTALISRLLSCSYSLSGIFSNIIFDSA